MLMLAKQSCIGYFNWKELTHIYYYYLPIHSDTLEKSRIWNQHFV